MMRSWPVQVYSDPGAISISNNRIRRPIIRTNNDEMMRIRNKEITLNDHSLQSIAAKSKLELEGGMPEAWLSWRLWPKPAVVKTSHHSPRHNGVCFSLPALMCS